MWTEIEDQKRRLDALRPLTGRNLAALEAWYDVELTYTSNAIEGNTLTRQETALLLEKGLTIGGKPMKDHLEALDHREALHYVRRLAERGEPLREGDIRELHRLVLARSFPAEAGRYSQEQRFILGSNVVLPSPIEIAPLMADFAAWVRDADPTPANAFEAHYRLVTIHPFADGNGRTARLVMNLLLLREGYSPVVIGPEHRLDYITSLEAAHSGGDKQPYERFMANRLHASLSDYLRAIEKEVEAQQSGTRASEPPRP
jgi:Fic family protein